MTAMNELLKRYFRLVLCLCLLTAGMALPAFASEAFQEKTISSSAKNRTGSVAAKTISGKKSDQNFTTAMANTSVRLLQQVSASGKKGNNVLISPDSILTIMNLAQSGAAGKTRKEMESAFGGISAKKYSRYLLTLHKRLKKARDMTYQSANSVWYAKGAIKLKKAFLATAAGYFGADVYAAPFDQTTVQDINNWVYNHTSGKISNIIKQLSPAHRLVLVNAIYFKGKWQEPYTDTAKHSFTREDGAKQSVEMLEGSESIYLTVGGGEGFIKPYRGGQAAFLALVPPVGTSVTDYVKGLTGDALIRGYQNRITKHIVVHTRIPVFSYDYSVSLAKALKGLGIRRAFGRGADFSKMTSSKIAIDQVLHKTHIRVDKEGTEAAAATAVVMKATSAYDPDRIIKTVYLDRPFVYGIIDVKTGIPLFLGVVYSPKA